MKKNIIKNLRSFLNGEFIPEHFFRRYFSAFLFLFFIWFLQVSMSHCADEKVSKIRSLKDTIKALEVKYVMQERKIHNNRLESKLKEKVEKIGLKPMEEYPITIKSVP